VHSFPFDLELWPGLRAAVEESGVRGVYSLPLQVQAAPMGALNLYSKAPTWPSDDHAELARAFARQAAIVLANAAAYAAAAAHVEQLEEGLRTREMIGQAKGILMERELCSADAAFEMLRQLSMRTNVKLRAVAEKIVASAEERGTGPR
jgi:GAF domain-containing protein